MVHSSGKMSGNTVDTLATKSSTQLAGLPKRFVSAFWGSDWGWPSRRSPSKAGEGAVLANLWAVPHVTRLRYLCLIFGHTVTVWLHLNKKTEVKVKGHGVVRVSTFIGFDWCPPARSGVTWVSSLLTHILFLSPSLDIQKGRSRWVTSF